MDQTKIFEMLDYGFYDSIDIIFKIRKEKTVDEKLFQGLSLIKKNLFSDAISLVEEIIPPLISQEQQKLLYEILLTSYNNLKYKEKLAILLENETFINCEKNLKLNFLIADAYILLDPTPSAEHKALPFLLPLYEHFPFSIEVIKRLIQVGFRDFNMEQLKTVQNLDLYVEGLIHLENRHTREALVAFQKINESIPDSPHILSQICLCAYTLQDEIIFDDAASKIPYTDPEIIDIRANRLKNLQSKDELIQLILQALSNNPNSAQNWLAFSHLLEFRGDITKALQTTNKAIRIDPNFRRAYLRQGTLRLLKSDNQLKALESFKKAHEIWADLESLSALIHCEVGLGNWNNAVVYAQAAIEMYNEPNSTENIMAYTLMGMAQKGIDLDLCMKILIQALEKDGENMEALSTIIDIKLENGDCDDAMKLLEKHKTPKNEFFYYFKMGIIYGTKKEYQTALQYMTRAHAIKPCNTNARDMLKQLEDIIHQDNELNAED